MNLSGKIALVTGASRGFGFATAAAFGAAGAHVIAVGRTVGGLEELDDKIQSTGGSTTLVPLDITDDAALGQLGASIHQRWGHVDVWLHTAAYAAPLQPAEHIEVKEIDRSIAVNIRAFQRLIRVVDPLLRLSLEPLALIAADDVGGAKFHGTYAMSKAAQSAITQPWAAETLGRITIVELQPPPMPTALRGRFHPGEDRAALTSIDTAADLLMRALDPLPDSGARITL